MDNARKKYVNIERLSSGDIFALLDLVESDDEGDTENIMNDSDTDFVAEDESINSTNIIRKEKIGNQSSSVSVPEASIHILPTKTRMKQILLVKMKQMLLLSLNVLPISHFLLPLNVLLISHLVLPLIGLQISHLLLSLNVLLISHMLLLLLDVLPISHLDLLFLL